MDHLRTAIDNFFRILIFYHFYPWIFMYNHMWASICHWFFFAFQILINFIPGYSCIIIYGPCPICHRWCFTIIYSFPAWRTALKRLCEDKSARSLFVSLSKHFTGLPLTYIHNLAWKFIDNLKAKVE